MSRYFGIVSYNGAAYSGFQRQNEEPSIQGELERVLSFLTGLDIQIAGAGRTDAGVHALGQTFTFDCDKPLAKDIVKKINKLLPKDINVLKVVECEPNFHARHSSCGKRYFYRLLPEGRRPFEVDILAQLGRDDFDASRFYEAIMVFKGEHDFKNFTSKAEDVDNFIRNISDIRVDEEDGVITTSFTGNGFMTYQIRLMMGAAIKVALGQLEVIDIKKALESQTRKVLSYKAPAEGLYLDQVYYEFEPGIQFALPHD